MKPLKEFYKRNSEMERDGRFQKKRKEKRKNNKKRNS